MTARTISSTQIAIQRRDTDTISPNTGVRGPAGRWPWPLPIGGVVAVFDTRASAVAAISVLAETGDDIGELWMVSGADGARRLEEAFVRQSCCFIPRGSGCTRLLPCSRSMRRG